MEVKISFKQAKLFRYKNYKQLTLICHDFKWPLLVNFSELSDKHLLITRLSVHLACVSDVTTHCTDSTKFSENNKHCLSAVLIHKF